MSYFLRVKIEKGGKTLSAEGPTSVKCDGEFYVMGLMSGIPVDDICSCFFTPITLDCANDFYVRFDEAISWYEREFSAGRKSSESVQFHAGLVAWRDTLLIGSATALEVL